MSPSLTQPSDTQPPNLSTLPTILSGAATHHAYPLWTSMSKYNPPSPSPLATPHKWSYRAIRPYLVAASSHTTPAEAERRVLMLANPSIPRPNTTDTLYTGLQLVLPGETAPAHRHTAFAVRFIIEGEGGYTAIQGQRIRMQKHDVILTPSWCWHDHGKEEGSEGPMIWLDGLDIPLWMPGKLPVHFVEHYKEARYPAVDVEREESGLVFPWKEMRERLDGGGKEWVVQEYRARDGGYISKTIGASAERINAGGKSDLRQETASSIYHVVTGSGYSIINDERIDWTESDTFCIPAWYKYEHFVGPGETVYLYRFDDKPMLEAVGAYRSADMDVDSLAETKNMGGAASN
ncbi:gentisate 1,2-dioxygenase [Sporormia fimetaria CBS 119925]|uniref:Gentisate 1,2-dioxygenase n=1 Tax=Sporormia fimetaria CBS 119925 TaxID=1340428 RepID=A0A6A6VQN1_9PLEO|nr:gentisate 1,2-dioxygenase [Sporormia fimetaria CBS 119925]